MGARVKDLTGNISGKLKVLKFEGIDKYGHSLWSCLCECGTIKTIMSNNFKGQQSCGKCIPSVGENRFGFSDPRLDPIKASFYRCWINMKSRCQNPLDKGYSNYGGRGITVCERWLGTTGFNNFVKDKFEEFEKCRKNGEKISCNRIDNEGNYSPENTEWVSQDIQGKNRQTSPATKDLKLWKTFKRLGLTINITIKHYDSSKYESLLQKSLHEMRKYIESLWLSGMSWNNYGNSRGQWNIDHIVALWKFDFSKEDDIIKAFHYSNYQPMWSIDNRRKNNHENPNY